MSIGKCIVLICALVPVAVAGLAVGSRKDDQTNFSPIAGVRWEIRGVSGAWADGKMRFIQLNHTPQPGEAICIERSGHGPIRGVLPLIVDHIGVRQVDPNSGGTHDVIFVKETPVNPINF